MFVSEIFLCWCQYIFWFLEKHPHKPKLIILIKYSLIIKQFPLKTVCSKCLFKGKWATAEKMKTLLCMPITASIKLWPRLQPWLGWHGSWPTVCSSSPTISLGQSLGNPQHPNLSQHYAQEREFAEGGWKHQVSESGWKRPAAAAALEASYRQANVEGGSSWPSTGRQRATGNEWMLKS